MNPPAPLPPRPSRGLHPAVVPGREPIFNMPRIVVGAIAALVAVHLLRLLMHKAEDLAFLLDWAVVPARWSVAFGAATADQVLASLAPVGEAPPALVEAIARYVLAEDGARPWTAITYAFLHGSWTHLLFNGVWLAAFGTPLARRLDPFRFVLLAAVSALGAAATHILLHPLDVVPLVGASGAVSGMMGAAAWFMFSPHGYPAQPHERFREPIGALLRNRRAAIFLGVWLVANYVFAVIAQPLAISEDGIAWQAHVGGLLVGFALFPLIDPLPPGPIRRIVSISG